MAVVVSGSLPLNINDVNLVRLKEGVAVQRAPTEYFVSLSDGLNYQFRGDGFQYDANGRPVGGTITSIVLFWDIVDIVLIQGLSTPMTTFMEWVDNNQNELAKQTLFAGADTLEGWDNDEVLRGYGGDDIGAGQQGNDRIYGEEGDDDLYGGTGDDDLFGGTGDDVLLGDQGNDLIAGEENGDFMLGGLGADTLHGGAGVDLLGGEDGLDSLFGGEGGDNVYGGAGADVMFGEAGDDFVSGQEDDDIVGGNAGSDLMHGGAGSDRFMFFAGDSVIGASDRILDFFSGGDQIDVRFIDANSALDGDQAFAWAGYSDAPTGAGTLRLGFIQDVGIFLFGYTDADGTADFIVDISTFAIGSGDVLL